MPRRHCHLLISHRDSDWAHCQSFQFCTPSSESIPVEQSRIAFRKSHQLLSVKIIQIRANRKKFQFSSFCFKTIYRESAFWSCFVRGVEVDGFRWNAWILTSQVACMTSARNTSIEFARTCMQVECWFFFRCHHSWALSRFIWDVTDHIQRRHLDG